MAGGDLVVFQGLVRRGYLGAERRRGTIVLVVFDQVGLGVRELCNLELVGVGEEHRLPDIGVDLLYGDLVHNFRFADVSCEVQRDG